jgi:hypothetical protein
LKVIENLDKLSNKSRDFRKHYSEFFKLLKENVSKIQKLINPFYLIVKKLFSLKLALKEKKNLKFTLKEYVRINEEIKKSSNVL